MQSSDSSSKTPEKTIASNIDELKNLTWFDFLTTTSPEPVTHRKTTANRKRY